MDQAMLGKVGNRVEETGTGSTVSPNSSTSEKVASNSASTSDTVNLTSSAKLLERLDKTLAALPAVDLDRVAEIKVAIENGDYEIDADAIADALIRIDRSLGG